VLVCTAQVLELKLILNARSTMEPLLAQVLLLAVHSSAAPAPQQFNVGEFSERSFGENLGVKKYV
jgi:hypothetical protein